MVGSLKRRTLTPLAPYEIIPAYRLASRSRYGGRITF
jgi:hypothetical protein